jgi:serine/threonine protein kinase
VDVGVEFEHYRVIEHIGRGGMADVWSARDKRLNRIVAVKTIARDLTLEADPIKMFEREAHTIAALEHPHILPIYDFGDYDRQLYIVMRYISGGSLDDILEKGPMLPQAALTMARAISSALDYAHQNNVVHLDLKPSNILLDSQGQPYLADFGLAAVMDREGQAQNPGSGTLLYMAPEQVTSDVLDHRADVYSFCILLFHMFTGTLPFDGTMPLALQQLQLADELPDISAVQYGLPYPLTLLLRRGTHVEPSERPKNVREITDALAELIDPASIPVRTGASVERVVTTPLPISNIQTVDLNTSAQTVQLESADALARREAMEIFAKARRVWASGQGRFTLGITDFTFINDFYSAAESQNLELDEAGRQMMLRGALEYDYEVDFWWEKVSIEGRRWVALHAVRGQNAAARVRALERLADLPDAEPPQIPKLVAQALQVENYRPAKLAAIHVLRERAKLVSNVPRMEFGRQTRALSQTASIWLTTRLKLWTPGDWRDVIYASEIDTMLATLALDGSDKPVAESAARAIGHIRSETALRQIADAQQKGMRGALRALALIRDEAPSLPGVPPAARIYAWWANTLRRLIENPMQIVWRFLWAFIGAAFGMGQFIYAGFIALPLFDPNRVNNTVSIGLYLGVFFGVFVVLAGELPQRLQGFWTWWSRLLLSAILGFTFGTLAWSVYTYMFLQWPPRLDIHLPLGIAMSFAFMITSVFRIPAFIAAAVAAVGIYVPQYLTYVNHRTLDTDPVWYVRPGNESQFFTYGILAAVLMAIGAFAQPLYREIRSTFRRNGQMRV